MALYLDSSALLKRYLEEPGSDVCERLLTSDPQWIIARHTLVETRRALARLLSGDQLVSSRADLGEDWNRVSVVELDAQTCAIAANIAEATGTRTFDALHIAAATRVGMAGLTLVTFDLRLAHAARALGFAVAGA